MERLILIYPKLYHYDAVKECVNEYYANEEYLIHGSALLDNYEEYAQWLEHVSNINVDPFIVNEQDSNVFLAYDRFLDKIIGFISLRNTLEDNLPDYFGQIGFSIRPNYRQNKYGHELLKLGVSQMKKRGHRSIMISCETSNIPSQKIILNTGGLLQKKIITPDNEEISVYLIKL